MTAWKTRLKAAAVHLCISLLIAGCAAWLVFGVWYPYPYREISGGRELFLLVVSVDVVLGPLITFVVFNLAKPRKELVRDLALVGLIQLAGLAYGLWSVHEARPVHLVFEIDRFRAVHAVEVPEEELSKTPEGVVALPVTGPSLLAVRPFTSERERVEATLAAIKGLHLGTRPALWQPYEQAVPQVLTAGRPAGELLSRFPARAAEIQAAIRETGQPADQLLYLPLISRKSLWTVLLDGRSARVVGFVPLDAF